jgi:uncharacterized protein (TIGR00730 family)
MPTSLKRICVFCGSSPGSHPRYAEAARHLGQLLASQGIGLVYGGAMVGLMGEVANAVLSAGGEVHGVIPDALRDREIAHRSITHLHHVRTMHDRKALMYDLSDAFIALPGGMGTLDELCEILTWAQLGLHKKPCGLINIAGYFNHLIAFFDHASAEQFLRPQHRALVMVEPTAEALLDHFRRYVPPRLEKWIDRDDT